MIPRQIKTVFELFPDNNLKKAIRYHYYNITNRFNFKIYPKRGGYKIVIYNMTFHFESDPFYELRASIPGYLMEYQLKRGDVVLDAGAYVGVFSIIAAKSVGEEGKVFAIEPDKKNCEELQRNIKRNQIKNITIIQKGLWSESTELKFSDTGVGGILAKSGFMVSDTTRDTIISVKVTTIDDIVKEHLIDHVDFIKMDIEGAEIEALKGSINTLKEFDVKLAIASYHEVDGKKTFSEVEKLLRKYGYDAKTTYLLHLTTYGCRK